jgi:hypothetical protein
MLRTHSLIPCVVSLCWFGSPIAAQISCNSNFTKLTSSAQSAPLGVGITFTAMVSVYGKGPVTSGTVTFLDAGSPIPGSTTAVNGYGLAAFDAILSPGIHSVTAAFIGSCPSSRVFVFVTAEPQPRITIASSANPAPYGTPLYFTVTLAPPVTGGLMPTGGVTLVDSQHGPDFDGSLLTTAQQLFPYVLNAAGQVSVQTPLILGFPAPAARGLLLAAGLHTVIAYYTGDANYAPAQVFLNQEVTKANSKITLSLSESVPQSITAVVAISPEESWAESVGGLLASDGPTLTLGDPSGNVQFFSGPDLIGTVPVARNGSAWAATLTTSSVNGNITANYSGDANYNSTCGLLRRLGRHDDGLGDHECNESRRRFHGGGRNLFGQKQSE